jgi:hypothetical protein
MRKLFQTQGAAELRPLLEPFHQAAVVQSKELPEHQECKQLGLGEFVRAVPMRVRRKRRLAHFERCPCQRYRISGCFAHTYVFGSPPSPLQDFSTEQDRYRIYHSTASLWEGTPSAYYGDRYHNSRPHSLFFPLCPSPSASLHHTTTESARQTNRIGSRRGSPIEKGRSGFPKTPSSSGIFSTVTAPYPSIPYVVLADPGDYPQWHLKKRCVPPARE